MSPMKWIIISHTFIIVIWLLYYRCLHETRFYNKVNFNILISITTDCENYNKLTRIIISNMLSLN